MQPEVWDVTEGKAAMKLTSTTETCDYCKGVGACPKCWGRAAIDELQARLVKIEGEQAQRFINRVEKILAEKEEAEAQTAVMQAALEEVIALRRSEAHRHGLPCTCGECSECVASSALCKVRRE